MARLDQIWRLCGTVMSFATFGVGGLFIGLVLFPAIHLGSADRAKAQRRCQIVVGRCFGLFIWLMKTLGVLSYRWEHSSRLKRTGLLVVANHPSLIDVVFIISQMPSTLCVVKSSHWRNPFVMGVMWATGYIPNDDPLQLVEHCVAALQAGHSLVIFPEGTRTEPGRPLHLKRGAASIIAASGKTFTPVSIHVEPTTLTKCKSWYEIPLRKPHWTLQVGDDVSPESIIVEGDSLSRNNRRVNRLLQSLIETKMVHSDGRDKSGNVIGSRDKTPDHQVA